MLDFSKLAKLIAEVGTDAARDLSGEEIVELALSSYFEYRNSPESTRLRLAESAPWVLWPLSLPLENFGSQYPLPEKSSRLTVVGVDGSQIMPSHHEVHNCYLLNVGITLISYGASGRAYPVILDSIPHLYHRPEDLYPLVDRRRIHIDELFVSLERTALELETLLEYSRVAAERSLPVVALYDGSLIPWSVDKMPDGYREHFQQRFQNALDNFQSMRIPLIGYISNSRSSDIVNILRTLICPYERADCRSHCSNLNEEDFPCSRVWPLIDRKVLAMAVSPLHRSSVYQSSSNATRNFSSANQVCFCYIRAAQETARVEFPRWLFDLPNEFELALSCLVSQLEKGMGYPIALSEAHHLAVIKGADRKRFFELIGEHLIGLGVKKVGTSLKESNKRQGFV